ncbi:MAG: hypothetical protein HYY03_02685 [Chloroflexi bacterium]|nr:hypothetical protein [Chloroflexota bacterium]
MMTEKRKAGKATTRPVREPVAPYETRAPLAEVLWLALKSLSADEQAEFLRKLLGDPDWYEELADAVAIIEARQEPTRPYEEFREELKREGLL